MCQATMSLLRDVLNKKKANAAGKAFSPDSQSPKTSKQSIKAYAASITGSVRSSAAETILSFYSKKGNQDVAKRRRPDISTLGEHRVELPPLDA